MGNLTQLEYLDLSQNKLPGVFEPQGASFAQPWWQQSYWPYPILHGEPNSAGVFGSFPEQALRRDPLATNKDDIPFILQRVS